MLTGLKYLNSLKPWAGQGGFRLDPIKLVLNKLGNPQDSYKTVHVAGTNGKGSVSTFIASGLGADGLKVGLNISPHLIELNERFIIDGLPVAFSEIDKAAAKVCLAASEGNIELSYHEAITAIAFLIFRDHSVDYAVIEVGLGGRLDASNVISKPEVCVITSIGYDHQDILGDSLEKIASEKAGIIKGSVPVVVGDVSTEAIKVIRDVALCKLADSYVYGREFSVSSELEVNSRKINLQGAHQLINASVAAKVLSILNVSSIGISKGLESTYWPARLEHLQHQSINVLFDCAHNQDGIKCLANYLKSNNMYNVPMFFGVLETKRWEVMIEELMPYVSEWNIIEPDSDRALNGDKILSFLSGFGISGRSFGKDYNKLINYINGLSDCDMVLFTGSIYMIGKVRSLLDIKQRPLWTRNQ